MVFFLMTFDYFAKPRPVEEYFGISISGLNYLMERFYKECEIP